MQLRAATTLDSISGVLEQIRWETSPANSVIPSQVKLDRLRREWWSLEWWKRARQDSDESAALDDQKRLFAKISVAFESAVASDWPLRAKLTEMITGNAGPDHHRWVGPHVAAVLACLNGYLPVANPAQLFVVTGNNAVDNDAQGAGMWAYTACWGGGLPDGLPARAYFGQGSQIEFAKAFMRTAALYHDIGKTISDDRHVSRGVHLIEDVIEGGRRSIESLFGDLWDAECLLALLKHHDVFGCLCTGEASLPALADMIQWISPTPFADAASGKSVIAQLSLLNWLNIADSDASLLRYYGGVTTVEALRYLQDWRLVVGSFEKNPSASVKHDDFATWAMDEASSADKTVERIARIVATCWRMETRDVALGRGQAIMTLVQRQLLALHGPRFQRFCWRFARFAKLDYGLKFFDVLMKDAMFENSARVPDDQALRTMVASTCSILARIVEEYGHLVDDGRRPSLRLGVDMSKLSSPRETGAAISRALRNAQTSAGALRWIVGEISIWLYD
jgi:hypothetical protein